MPQRRLDQTDAEPAAANGLLDRRALLRGVSTVATALGGPATAAVLQNDPWSLAPGGVVPGYEAPSRFEAKTLRTLTNPTGAAAPQVARTPLQLMQGTVTANGLHYVVSRSVPEIDPEKHRLVIHGMVRQPLMFTVDALTRYPMISRMAFLECGGNSAPLFAPQPVQADLQALHGLVSCAEWSGVLLSTLLEEAGVDPAAKWLIAEGADAASLSRSVPLAKAMDDAMIALYQNGERLMPSNGYPIRLLLPGWEGNMNIKWLRRITLTDAPAMTFPETRLYTPLLPDGRAHQFYFIQEVKAFITQPSPGLSLHGAGFYEISGLAYSGHGRIARVMVSADGGTSWAEAALQEPVLPKAFTRFRLPWRWDGGPAVLQSRAWDDAGHVQPTRAESVAARGELKTMVPVTAFASQHNNAVTSWGVDVRGGVSHVYA